MLCTGLLATAVMTSCSLQGPSQVWSCLNEAVPCMGLHLRRRGLVVQAKNKALAAAGATVPKSFEDFEGAIRAVFEGLVKEGTVTPRPDVAAPTVPLDLEAAKKAGKVGVAAAPACMPVHCRPINHAGINLPFG